MNKEDLLKELRSLEKNLLKLQKLSWKSKENSKKHDIDQVKYFVSGISYSTAEIGQKIVAMNQGKMFNNIILEEPVNVMDVFVKLGEVKIISGSTVPYLKKLLTMTRANRVDIDLVTEAIPHVEEYILNLKEFLRCRSV
ncbi:hypothetical protein KAW96_09625 [candidate division WOR-3 bacterium]|nr:hypothetical protein [candidate division WOR-3 bacterium]